MRSLVFATSWLLSFLKLGSLYTILICGTVEIFGSLNDESVSLDSLQTAFEKLGHRNGCPVEERYAEILNQISTSWSMKQKNLYPFRLKLPHNARLLFYGHSYLRQVFDNLLAANFEDMNAVQNIHYLGFMRINNPLNEEDECVVWSNVSRAIEYDNIDNMTQAGHNIVFGPSVEYRFEQFNTTIVTVINNWNLQDWTCINNGELETYLDLYEKKNALNKFTAIVYMLPHGSLFFSFIKHGMEGKPLPPRLPVDLRTMNSIGPQPTAVELTKIFSRHTDRLIYTFPWRGEMPWQGSLEDNRSHIPIDYSSKVEIVDFNDFVKGSSLSCATPNCKNESFGHQCNPGPLTLAAEKLSDMLTNPNPNLKIDHF